MSGPLLGKLRSQATGKVSRRSAAASPGVQVGGLLAYMSSKVLGQYEVFGDDTGDDAIPASGRLLLVAPNIAEVERRSTCPPAISGCGSACTSRPTASSSPRCRGCAST